MSKAWFMLIVAGLLEVGWAIGIKYTDGFSRLVPSVLTIGMMVVSMYLLARAAQNLPIGTAYAVWVGIGASGAATLGILLFKEPVSPTKILFLVLLVISIVGLKLSTNAAH